MADLLIGIDAGTSVIKAVAFDLQGRPVGQASVPNAYATGPDGSGTQPMARTWADCAETLRQLGEAVPNLAARTAALGVTGQGDGTWLVDAEGEPVGDAWLWLDGRAAPTAEAIAAQPGERLRFEITGTGLNACQQGVQLAHMLRREPERLVAAATAMHCKDWLYLNLTGVRATDPAEASFTFGDFRTRAYDDRVVEALGLTAWRHLLPPIVDGTRETAPLTAAAAAATGLAEGTPVALGFLDVVCTAIGAGVYTGDREAGVTVVGSTGMHMRATAAGDVVPNAAGTGYVMPLPVPGVVAQMQSNMASTLNIDWLLGLAADLACDLGRPTERKELLVRLDRWIAESPPGELLYHPYISEAGERGPFVDGTARAGFVGLGTGHRFGHLVRAVVEGLGLAGRDCYEAMGGVPAEVRLTGGAARSGPLRAILAAMLGAPVRTSSREEAGAAGAAMMAAVAIGAHPSMEACIAGWVTPLLGPPEPPDPDLARRYAALFPAYLDARRALQPVWRRLADLRETDDA